MFDKLREWWDIAFPPVSYDPATDQDTIREMHSYRLYWFGAIIIIASLPGRRFFKKLLRQIGIR